MTKMQFPRFKLEEIPEYQRFRNANPNKTDISSLQTAIMYGRAIQWISFLDIIWPDFNSIDRYLTIELMYIVINDPDENELPTSFYEYLRNMIIMFWELQLEKLYPNGDWTISVDDDPEMTIEVEIISRA